MDLIERFIDKTAEAYVAYFIERNDVEAKNIIFDFVDEKFYCGDVSLGIDESYEIVAGRICEGCFGDGVDLNPEVAYNEIVTYLTGFDEDYIDEFKENLYVAKKYSEI